VTQFEYITALSSIVIAFALSEILSAWGDLVRNRKAVRGYWVHTGWTVLLFLGLIQIWWGTWQYREIEFTSFASLLLLLAAPLTLSFAVFVFAPRLSGEEVVDLRQQYESSRKWFFPLMAVVLAELCAVDWVVAHQPVLHPENLIRGLGIVAVSALASVASPRAHQLALVALFLLFFLFVRMAYQAG
jgi:hypothetical protein